MAMSKIDKSTLLPIGLVGSLFLGFFCGYNYLETRFRSMERLLEAVDRRMERVEDRQQDGWSKSDQLIWAAKLARDNPAMNVPPPGGGG